MKRASHATAGRAGIPARRPPRDRGIEVSVVLPVFEEADQLEDLLGRIEATLRRGGRTFEIVVVDDGSKDETAEVLKRLAARHRRTLTVVRHLVNRGNGAALRSGIHVARGEIVVTMDADGQHAPEDIPSLLRQMPPFDLVVGARGESYVGSWYRGAANRFYNTFSSWLARTRIPDLTSGFRAMRRQVVLHFLPLFPQGFSAPTTTTLAFLKAGYNVAFVPIHVGTRKGGKSKIRLWEDGTRFLIIIVRMILLYDPLRIFFPVGVILGLLGVAAWIAGLAHAQRLVFPNSSIFLFSATLLVWLLGLLADQISNMRVSYHGDEGVILEGGSPTEGGRGGNG
ncbi:MAG TPA: glycosyltransferase family 2 protein [Anaerolineales bacterium]|nr:glycosyltransferase family 2 protein [Anaerolineales bacterium]